MRAAREAPGCLDFAITADTASADRIQIYQRWSTNEELLAFRSAGPAAGQQAAILDAHVRKYRISSTEDP